MQTLAESLSVFQFALGEAIPHLDIVFPRNAESCAKPCRNKRQERILIPVQPHDVTLNMPRKVTIVMRERTQHIVTHKEDAVNVGFMIGKVSCRLCEAAEHCCCSRGRNPSLVKTIVEEYQAEADLLEAVLHYGLESVNLISLHDSPRQFVRRDACPECLPEQIYTACSAFLVKHIAVPSEVFVQESSFLKLSSPVVFAQTTQRRRKDLAFPGEACDDAGCAIVRSHLFERFLKCESIKVLWPFLNERHILLAAKVLTNFFEESTFACAATTYNEVGNRSPAQAVSAS